MTGDGSLASQQPRWTDADVPDQQGRVAVVTGANSGIGFEAALVLARRGAATVLACRDAARGKDAADRIAAAAPGAAVSAAGLDLASLASIRGGGEFYGPGGWMQFKGYPIAVRSTARSHDEGVQRRLWQESEQLTGVTFPV